MTGTFLPRCLPFAAVTLLVLGACASDAEGDADPAADGGTPPPPLCTTPPCEPGSVLPDGAIVPTTRASSTDGIKNGSETDVDCGSGGTGDSTSAPPCAVGKNCIGKADCADADCVSGVCTFTGTDGFKNGTESDVDCGGTDTGAARCALGKTCNAPADCASDACMRDGPNQGKCIEGKSCATTIGGQTCGAGELGEGGIAHESCCKSLPLPTTFSDRLHPGKRVYLDKYEITAGRMREFFRRMEEQYGGEAKVQTWIKANTPAYWVSSADEKVDWTHWLPEGKSTPAKAWDFNRFKPPGAADVTLPVEVDVGTDRILGPAGYYFYTHGHNCDGSAYPTYWYDKATWENIHGGDFEKRMSQEQLDVRSLNCVPNALLAAFCAWDGGQLATTRVLAAVTNVTYAQRQLPTCTVGDPGCGADGWYYGARGRLPFLTEGAVNGTCANAAPTCDYKACPGNPGCALANYSNDAGQLLYAPKVPYEYYPAGAPLDFASRIAAPGRMTRDATRINPGDEPWMDLRGNLHELSLNDEAAGTRAFGGVHYDSIGRRGKDKNRDITPEFKIAQAGGRCMRFRDE